MKTRQQDGFTLIELVIVIVILGILAATAIPQFVGLSGDARASVMKATEGAMRSANIVIYAKAAANEIEQDGDCSSTATCVDGNEPVVINGQTIRTRFGYAYDASELRKAMDLSPASDFETSGNRIEHRGAITGADCSVTYGRAEYDNNAFVLTPPSYTLDVSNCN